MTDDSESDSTDEDTPGGGPNRVVSETSVDDILGSIETPPGRDSSSEADRKPTRAADENLEERIDSDENDSGSADDADGIESNGADESGSNAAEENGTDSAETTGSSGTGTAGSDTSEGIGSIDSVEAGSDHAEPKSGSETVGIAESDSDEDDASNTDASSVVRTEDSTETSVRALSEADTDLVGRIERGEISGSDVRAAEAGEGREKTPEIDEVDLSIDDLEAGSATGVSSTESTADPDDSPKPTNEGKQECESEDGESESRGVIGRLKALFSK